MSQRSPLRPCLGNLTTPMAKAVGCCWRQGAVCEKCTENASLSTLLHCSALTPPILMEKCWQRRVFSALFANSTLTSTAAYSFSHGCCKVPKTWAEGASLRHVAITLSFRRASLSKLRLTIFELFFACILPTKYKNQNVSTKPPPNLLWLAAVKRRPAVMQPTLQTRVCRFQEEKQP